MARKRKEKQPAEVTDQETQEEVGYEAVPKTLARPSQVAQQRKSVNAFGDKSLSVNENIIKTIHHLYTQENGLLQIAEGIQLKDIHAPRKKIRVLLCGNHSSGKSSFINWYVGEHVQRTGVAIETQGFTLVTKGKTRNTLKGDATLELFSFLDDLKQFKGVKEYLNTEISISTARKFPLAILIDSPGLVDGSMKYPFDVEHALLWFADQCDLIFVFFDPNGLALGHRTLNVVKKLNEKCNDKVRYYLARADEMPNERDRQKVAIQITMDVASRLKNHTAFELPTIYIPEKAQSDLVPNRIEEVCDEIEKAITLNVQGTLNTLVKDCERISARIDAITKSESEKRQRNGQATRKGLFVLFLAFSLPFWVVMWFLNQWKDYLPSSDFFGGSSNSTFVSFFKGLGRAADHIGPGHNREVLVVSIASFLILLLLSKIVWKHESAMTRTTLNMLKEQQLYVKKNVMKIKEDLYQKFFNQAVSGDF